MESVESFLVRCQSSSQSCYDTWKELLTQLENQTSRSKARRFLEQIVEQALEKSDASDFQKKHHFSIDTLVMGASAHQEEKLLLLNFPSIFTPEDWSFTFFEGLTRYPVSEFEGRGIVELGCGNGWITLALAKRCSPNWIKGLDINPRAITCAKINAYLNFFNGLGHPLEANDGQLLIDKVEFLESDLLGAVLNSGKSIDRVIGCIPQVLNPDPEKTLRFVSEMTSDEMLHSLSNYCEKQGYIEDQFGLGLVARAIEESVEVLKPSGKLILNLGGRPGQKVLERMFTRRGFHVKKVWGTRVLQAADTDIDALVEIEKHSNHRFEFFMGLVHEEPISAQAAQAVGMSGGEIGHALSVFEGRIRSQTHLKKLFVTLKQSTFADAKSSLDLSYASDSLVEEKLAFLAELSVMLHPHASFPYEKVAGQTDFKRRLAEFFRSYWRIPTTAKSFLVAPNRQEIIANTLLMLDAKRVLVDKELAHLSNLKPMPFLKLPEGAEFVLEIPRSAEQICEFVAKLNPQIAICVLDPEDAKSLDSLKRLIQVAADANCLLLLDVSLDFELSSSPKTTALFRLLNSEPLPHHLIVLCGLVRNKVYADLELAFVYSECAAVLDFYEKVAEITYSRTPLLTQKYYDRILFDLLSFQMPRARGDSSLRLPKASPTEWTFPLLVPFSRHFKKCFDHVCFVPDKWKPSPTTLRLDYGENEFFAPTELSNAVLESFVRENLQPSECDVTQEVLQIIDQRLPYFGNHLEKNQGEVIAGHGVAPLFSAILCTMVESESCLLLPMGAYGFFEAAAFGHGVTLVRIETKESSAFKVRLEDLKKSYKVSQELQKCKAYVYLNIPVVNPTGAVYEAKDLIEILEFCRVNEIVVIADAIFAGLEFENPSNDSQSFGLGSSLAKSDLKLKWIVLGGFSKEYAAGGLRFGFACSNDAGLAREVKQHLRSAPHATTLYAAKKILTLQIEESKPLITQLAAQKKILKDRAQRLVTVLESKEWTVLKPQGGLFLVAKPPQALLDQMSANEREDAASQLHKHIYEKFQVLLNPPSWTGLPGYFRFVLSVEETTFENALLKIQSL
jgi:methionine S-methyltransferase